MHVRRYTVALYLFLISLPTVVPDASAQEAAAQTIEVRLKKNNFRIPEMYFLPRFRGHLRSPLERTSIYLGFRLPDAAALSSDYDENLGASSAETLARWTKQGHVAVEVILTATQRKDGARWAGSFASGNTRNDVITRFMDAGLEGRYIARYSGAEGKTRELVVFRSTDAAHYFRCENRPSYVERSCSTELWRDDELRVEILFLEAALPNWKEILSKTVKFVDSWRLNAAPR